MCPVVPVYVPDAPVVFESQGANEPPVSDLPVVVREADVQIYAMDVFEPSFSMGTSTEEVSGPRLLAEIAEQTGGRAFSATVGSDLASVATRIGIELRNQYVLACTAMRPPFCACVCHQNPACQR